MINTINNINFKGVYTPKFTRFSDSQQKVYDDIKAKLGKEIKNNDFFMKPSQNDSVELSKVYGVKETGYGLDKKYSYMRRSYIGRYDEKNLFEIKDYKDFCKQEFDNLWGALAVGVFAIGMMLGGLYLSTNKKMVKAQQVETVTTMVKDSLETIKKDRIKFFK